MLDPGVKNEISVFITCLTVNCDVAFATAKLTAGSNITNDPRVVAKMRAESPIEELILRIILIT